MESFTVFTSLAIIDHIILYYFLQQDFAKMTGYDSQYIASEVQKQK